MQTRRGFLAAATAFACAPYMRTFAAQAKPRLRMGVMSDIHVRAPGWTYDPFVAALKWFDERKVDGLVLAGDLADLGFVEQLKLVGEAFDRQFPNGKAADGRPVAKAFVTGNHDNHFYNHAAAKKLYPDDKERFDHAIAKDFNAAWTTCFHEEYVKYRLLTVKGYSFVCRQYNGDTKEIAPFLSSVKTKLDPRRPFFYVQHQHLKDTCYGPWAWGRDDGASTKALSAFPNAVAFSGHSHYSLTDERSVWQGAFTSVGTGTLMYSSTPYGYENGDVDSGDKQEPVKEMARVNCGLGKQGMVMDVFDDRIVLARHDFGTKGVPKLGPDWELPLPYAEPGPFAFASRAATHPVPQFARGATASVRRTEGANRKKERHAQVVVSFPVAAAVKGARAFDYEVRVLVGGKETALRRVLAPAFHRAPSEDRGEVTCVFAAADVPAQASFSVTPRNCYGKAGKAILQRRGRDLHDAIL